MVTDRSAEKLNGRVAVVTGGASGIGRASALALAGAGATVVVADIDSAGAIETRGQIEALGATALEVIADVAVESEVEAMVGHTVSAFGRLDILHNNAALTSPEVLARDTSVTAMTVDVWEQTMNVNLRSQMLTCKYAIPEMVKTESDRRAGSIINMSSGAAFTGGSIRAAYGTSKAGVVALTRYVAASHGKQGIRANTIVPGLILTDAVKAQVPQEMLDGYAEQLLTPAVGQPADIAELVVFLASDDSRYITGQTIVIDGGLSIHSP